jgi:Gpi18-like mannosyltransferase
MKILYSEVVDQFPFLQKNYFWAGIIFVGLLLKVALFPFETGDYHHFLRPWIDFIERHHYFSALQYDFHNYTPSYIYILVFIAKAGFNPLYSIKAVSVLFEYLLAFFVGKTIGLKYKNRSFIWISLAIIPLIPTVLLNSSYLSQCDSIYSAFAVGSIYFMLKKRPWLAALFFGLAFAFKLQTIMLLPFFFVMMLRRQIKPYHFLAVPAVYFLSVLPAWFMGGNLYKLLTVYIAQSDHYKFLTVNFPNLYILISNDYYETGKYIGLCVTFLATLIAGIVLSRKKFEFTFEHWIQWAFLSAVAVPFLLPGMHERYMYPGDVLGVLYFLIVRKNIAFPAGIILVSFYSYLRCSRYNEVIPQAPAFFLYLFMLIVIIWDFKCSLKQQHAIK